MGTWSDSFLSSFQFWVSWIAIIGTSLGLLSAITTVFARQESSARQTAKENARTARVDAAELALESTREKLIKAEFEAKEANDLARIAHSASIPRSLTDEQRKKLILGVSSAPKGPIAVKANLFDSEAEAYAAQIKDALVAAGANVVELGGAGIVSLHKQGGSIIIMNSSNIPLHTGPIAKSFADVGIDLPPTTYDSASFPVDMIVVWISRK